MRIAANGISLNVEVTGDGPIVLMLHGFTGDVTTWEPVLPFFEGYRVIRVDLIGHGLSDSPADPERYSMDHAVEDLTAMLHHLHVDTFALLGYSMGGRVALHLALTMADRLWALVLESASPGLATTVEQESRAKSDHELATSIDEQGLEAFVDRWQDQPLFASQSSLARDIRAEQREQRLRQSPVGLANSLRGMGTGTQRYLLRELQGFPVPVQFLTGALDERYTMLALQMQKELGPVKANGLPYGEVDILGGAGHAVHFEQPYYFAMSVVDFLKRVRKQRERRRLTAI